MWIDGVFVHSDQPVWNQSQVLLDIMMSLSLSFFFPFVSQNIFLIFRIRKLKWNMYAYSMQVAVVESTKPLCRV